MPSNGVGMKAANQPFKIKIASPCPARWEDMGGDDRVRFCDQCRKNVYNLSAMSAPEARELVAEKNGNLCARMYQRADGTVMTEDCPVGVARYWRRVKAMVAGGVAAVLFALTCVAALGRDRADAESGKRDPVTQFAEDAVWQVKVWLGLNPPRPWGATLGEVAPLPVTGKVAVPPPQNPPPPPPPPEKK